MSVPKVFIIVAVSVDGFIAKSSHEHVDWTSPEDKKHFAKLTTQAGVVVMGNNTYQTLSKPFENRLNVVYTNNPNELSKTPNVMITSMSPRALIDSLQKKGFEEIAIIGGQVINTLFLQAGLVDEIYITIEPQLFGTGLNFNNLTKNCQLELFNHKPLNKNSVLLHYKVINKAG